MKKIDHNETIFKYMPLSDQKDRFSWVLHLLEKKQIYVPNSRQLNDPFENLLKAHLKRKSTNLIHESLEERLNEIQNLKTTNCCSFSIRGHSKELMWSYYADSWKGIRLHFKLTEQHKIYHVHYFDKSEKITGEETHLEILRKLKAWEHERECRFITHKKSGYYDFEELGIQLTQVDIGIRADKYLSEVIKRKCEAINVHCSEIDKILDVFQE